MSCDISASPAPPELLARVRREAMVLACAIAGLHQTLSRMSQANSGSCHPDGSGPHVTDNAGFGGASDGAPESKSYVPALSVLGAAERSELLRVTTELLTLEAPEDEVAEAAAEAAMAAAAAAEAAAAAAKARKLAERERKEQQRRQLAAAAEPGPGPATGSEVEAGAGTGAVAVASTHSTAGVTAEVPGVSSAASAGGPVAASASLPQAACTHEASVGPCAAGASPSSSQPAPPAVALGLPALEPGVCSSKPLDAVAQPSASADASKWRKICTSVGPEAQPEDMQLAVLLYKAEVVLVEDLNYRLEAAGQRTVDHVSHAVRRLGDKYLQKAEKDELSSILVEAFSQLTGSADDARAAIQQWPAVMDWHRRRVAFAHPLGNKTIDKNPLGNLKAQVAVEEVYAPVRFAAKVLIAAAERAVEL